MKILIISPKNKTVFNFRGDLIRNMIANGHEVIVTGPDRVFVDDIYALGVSKFIEIPLVKDNASIKGDLLYFNLLKRVMRKERPDLVFSYTIKPVIYGSIAAKSEKVKGIYAMVTGLGRVFASNGLKTRIIRFITKRLYKKAFKSCNSVIFQNRDDLHFFTDHRYLPKEKAKLVHGSGVNMSRFARTPVPNDPSFLMVGRIIKEKGVLDYCEAARIVKNKHPNVRFVLLGGFDNSIGAIDQKDIQPYVEQGIIDFPGEVNDPAPFYQKCSVFVLPSYYREGLPRTILEAMSSGRAVITTDWPGCREPVIDNKTGFIVPIKNSLALAKKMEAFIENPALIHTMGCEAYTHCLEKYEVSVINSRMKTILGY